MGWNGTTGKMTAPLNINQQGDVQQALASSRKDIGGAIIHGTVNPYSFRKPFVRTSPVPLSDDGMRAINWAWANLQGDKGVTLLKLLQAKLEGQTWSYHQPDDNDDTYFRFYDFISLNSSLVPQNDTLADLLNYKSSVGKPNPPFYITLHSSGGDSATTFNKNGKVYLQFEELEELLLLNKWGIVNAANNGKIGLGVYMFEGTTKTLSDNATVGAFVPISYHGTTWDEMDNEKAPYILVDNIISRLNLSSVGQHTVTMIPFIIADSSTISAPGLDGYVAELQSLQGCYMFYQPKITFYVNVLSNIIDLSVTDFTLTYDDINFTNTVSNIQWYVKNATGAAITNNINLEAWVNKVVNGQNVKEVVGTATISGGLANNATATGTIAGPKTYPVGIPGVATVFITATWGSSTTQAELTKNAHHDE